MDNERTPAEEAAKSAGMFILYLFLLGVLLFAIFGTAFMGIAPIPVVP